MEFSFRFHISEQDYLDFNLFHAMASKSGKKSFLQLRLMSAALFLLAGGWYLLQYGLNLDGVIAVCVFSGCAIASFFSFKYVHRFILKRHFKSLKKQGKLPYSQDAAMTFTDTAFTESTDINKSEFTYSAICDAYIVNDRMLYLYIDTLRAFILPVSAFESKAQLDAFLDFIGQKAVAVTACDFERSPYMEPIFPENTHK